MAPYQDSSEAPKLLITGGAGFLGSALTVRAARDYRITLFDNLTRDSLRFVEKEDLARVTLVRGDITDLSSVQEVVRERDIVVHMAAVAGVSKYYEQPYEVMNVNLGGTLNLLRAMEESPPKRLIFLSSSEVYGVDAMSVSEDFSLTIGNYAEPRWAYAVSKVAGEKICLMWGKERNIEVISLRPFNIYGPGQTGEGAVSLMVQTALAGGDLIVHGDGTQVRAWCYVDDFVEAAMAAIMLPGLEQEVLNIGNPAFSASVNELAELIVELTGRRSRIVHKPHPGVDIPLRTPVINRAQRVLGYEPKVSLDVGLARTIIWYRNHGG